MVYCFKKVNVSLPRTSNQQSKKGKKVEQKNLQAGDLVFFIIQSVMLDYI